MYGLCHNNAVLIIIRETIRLKKSIGKYFNI